MEIPDGMKGLPKQCLKLKKSIHGLVQASRFWWKTFTGHLKAKAFQVSKADTFLFIQQDRNGICVFVLYVDDALLMGSEEAIEKAIKDI